MQFKIGDKVVYPNHGLGVIEQIKIQDICGQRMQFYQLHLQENNSTVLIPIQNTQTIGLRRIIDRKEVRSLMHSLQCANPELMAACKEWKSRFKENTEKMKTGRISDVADVLKVLASINSRKALSFREKKMYDRARMLLVSEIAAAENTPGDLVEQKIDQALLKAIGPFSGTA
jgi:CarD family transcriptional regulator